MELLLSNAVIGSSLIGLLLWFLRAEFKRTREEIKSISQAQTQCQLENAKVFTTKPEVQELRHRVDENTKDISVIQGTLKARGGV